jgi:large conductance mechanosensitive channel
MAVGVIIGAAFGAIINSLVDDIISPLIGLLFDTDFSALVATIGSVEIKYGSFVTAVINFILIALVLFCIIKAANKAKEAASKKEPEAEPTTKVCPYCLSEIPLAATRCAHCTSQLDK